MKDYKKLVVWQKAHEFVLGVYVVTKVFPADEVYGLTRRYNVRQSPSLPT